MNHDALPTATVHPARSTAWLWLLPLLALFVALGLFSHHYLHSGIQIEVSFGQGHGLKPGDALRYRGIDVGVVDQVRLSDPPDGIIVEARLFHDALARSGSRFWIVRPQLGLSGSRGLETLIGAKYIAVHPAEGVPTHRFTGLEQPPVEAVYESGSIEVTLHGDAGGALQPGAQVSYREVPVGHVTRVGLSDDASQVEVTLILAERYRALLRAQTRFWQQPAFRLDVGLIEGLSLEFGSLKQALLGGVALALPPDPGPPADDEHLFRLHAKPEDEWLRWRTALPLSNLVRNTPPAIYPAQLHWQDQTLWIQRTHMRQGVLVRLDAEHLVGPQSVLWPPEDAENARYSIEGQHLDTSARRWGPELALLPYPRAAGAFIPPHRIPLQAETIWVVLGERDYRIIAAEDIDDGALNRWPVSASIRFGPRWHGAPVYARSDDHLIGLLDVRDDRIDILPLPQVPTTDRSDP